MYKQKNIFSDDRIRFYEAGEVISKPGSELAAAGIIIEGRAFLESTDSDGARRIIDIYRAGDMFTSESFPSSALGSVYLIARARCAAAIFEKNERAEIEEVVKSSALKTGTNACGRMLAHIHILGQHTLRQKLTAFFEYEKSRQGCSPFKIEITFSDLADLIGADRSAMMRELKRMCDENIIKRSGRTVEI